MAVRQLRYFEDPALRKVCQEVQEINDRTRQQLDDMMDTLHASGNGAALAANQVGILKRMVVIDYCGQYLKLVNPEIMDQEGEQLCVEGCLSFPGRAVETLRPRKVSVRARREDGSETVLTAEGELAKCFCHEIDHLDGIIFLDRSISAEKRDSSYGIGK